MKDNRSLPTSSYAKELTERVLEIETNAKNNKVRRIILFYFMVTAAAGGILYGIYNKVATMDNQYRQYAEMHDRSVLTPELLAYKDTYNLFVSEYLGNEPSQSMMGGYFYLNDSCFIHPDEDTESTIITLDGQEQELSSFHADNINVRGEFVIFRNPATREMISYDIKTQKTSSLGIFNAGQFVLCGDDYIYIDLSKASLERHNYVTGEKSTLIENGVSSFAIAGNDIIFLDASHFLKNYNLTTGVVTTLSDNITTFTFNGTLWLQNNKDVFQKRLDAPELIKINLGLQCNRLLGVTESYIIFESVDGVYVYYLSDNTTAKLCNELFLGTCNDMVFCISLD